MLRFSILVRIDAAEKSGKQFSSADACVLISCKSMQTKQTFPFAKAAKN